MSNHPLLGPVSCFGLPQNATLTFDHLPSGGERMGIRVLALAPAPHGRRPRLMSVRTTTGFPEESMYRERPG